MDTAPLTDRLDTFVQFVHARTGDPEFAADIVQECLLRALRSAEEPENAEATVQWFYRVLRNAVIDAHRRRTVRERSQEEWERAWPQDPEPEDRRSLCQCFHSVLPALPPGEAELIRRVDLEGESPTAIAGAAGQRVNTVNVRLHRARRNLRTHLEQLCRTCARHGCLDCDCAPPSPPPSPPHGG